VREVARHGVTVMPSPARGEGPAPAKGHDDRSRRRRQAGRSGRVSAGSAAAGPKQRRVLSAWLMFERFAKALRVAVREEGFVQILGAGIVLVAIGTLTYTTSQDWSLVDGFYFAVATLTTSSIADPELTITGAAIKIFTVFYILVGIGILVELARQLGFAYVQVRREEKAEKAGKAEHAAKT
jgi:hypothetical protein